MNVRCVYVAFACLILLVWATTHADPPALRAGNPGDSSTSGPRVALDLDADMDQDGTVEDSDVYGGEDGGLGLCLQPGKWTKIRMFGTPDANVAGSVVLEASTTGGGHVRVWDHTDGPPLTPIIDTTTADKSQSWTLSASFKPSALSSRVLYVQGANASTAPCDVTLTIKYQDPAGKVTDHDTVKVTVIQFTLEQCAADWLPLGGTEDNTTTIRAHVAPDMVVGRFNFELFDVSTEPGYCMNQPLVLGSETEEDGAAWYDLQFAAEQTGFTVAPDRLHAETVSDECNDKTITVKSYDYGAFGKIRVTFVTKIGGHILLGANGFLAHATIPRDEDGNFIPDSAPQNSGPTPRVDGVPGTVPSRAANDDNEHVETVLLKIGDGFTRYQEWRGFMVADPDDNPIHRRTSVTVRDVMVYDENGLGGLDCYQAITGIATHEVLETQVLETQVPEAQENPKRQITIHRKTAPGVAQYAMHIKIEQLAGRRFGTTVRGTPRTGGPIDIDYAKILSYGHPLALRQALLNYAIVHEMGHCSTLGHHTPKATGGDPCMMQYLGGRPRGVTADRLAALATICTSSPPKCLENIDVKDK